MLVKKIELLPKTEAKKKKQKQTPKKKKQNKETKNHVNFKKFTGY